MRRRTTGCRKGEGLHLALTVDSSYLRVRALQWCAEGTGTLAMAPTLDRAVAMEIWQRSTVSTSSLLFQLFDILLAESEIGGVGMVENHRRNRGFRVHHESFRQFYGKIVGNLQ